MVDPEFTWYLQPNDNGRAIYKMHCWVPINDNDMRLWCNANLKTCVTVRAGGGKINAVNKVISWLVVVHVTSKDDLFLFKLTWG